MLEFNHMRLLFLLLLMAVFLSPAHAGPSKFLSHEFWDDGKAEISVYDAKCFHYGRLYTSKIEYFLVKELFSSKELVKTNQYQSKDSIPVIKLNQVISTPTGTYDYQQMHSSFWSKQTGKLIKFSLSHHEACGASFKKGELRDHKLNISGSTYWEGQANIEDKIIMEPNIWLYDELPLRARMLLADSQPIPANLQVVPSVIHSKTGSFLPAPAQISIQDHTVTVIHTGGKDVLKFDSAWPHVMNSWQQANGGSLTLKKSVRLPYWNHHAPGDEKLLE